MILNTDAEKKTPRVVWNDIERTRVRERKVMPSFKDYAGKIIVFYLQQNGISYKQGLNEIVGAFLMIKYNLQMSFTRLYTIFCCFMDKFLPNYYNETEFYSLQSSLSLITILLKYHDAEVFNYLDYGMITPEMYATPWVLTIFANKCSLDVIYHLWDKLILFNDPLFLHFFMVALLIKNRENILNNDLSQVPSQLSQITITSIDEVDSIIEFALDLSEKTPYSFRIFAKKLEIFRYNSPRLQELYQCYEPENLLAMPIFPSEIFTITYKDSFGCPEIGCKNFDLRKRKQSPNIKCFYCNSRKKQAKISYILLDLRLFDKDNQKNKENKLLTGFLPNSVAVEEKDMLSKDFPKNLIDKYIKEKEKYHFMLITSKTDYFKEFEDKYYKEEDKQEKQTEHFGLITKVNKELNLEIVKSHLKKDKSHKLQLKIKELDNFKKAIDGFLKEKFPYISYIYGGFDEIHDFSMKNKIELLDHNASQCYLCERGKKGIFSSLKSILQKSKDVFSDLGSAKTAKPKPVKEALQAAKPELTVEGISELIISPNVIQFPCVYRCDYDLLKGEEGEFHSKERTIMVFVTSSMIMVYQENKENDKLNYILIRDIPLKNIDSIVTKNTAGNIATITYKESGKEPLHTTVVFSSESDARKFKRTIRKYNNNFNNKKSKV